MFSRYPISSTVIHGAVVSARLSKKAIHVLLKKVSVERYKQGITIVEGRLVEKASVQQVVK